MIFFSFLTPSRNNTNNIKDKENTLTSEGSRRKKVPYTFHYGECLLFVTVVIDNRSKIADQQWKKLKDCHVVLFLEKGEATFNCDSLTIWSWLSEENNGN